MMVYLIVLSGLVVRLPYLGETARGQEPFAPGATSSTGRAPIQRIERDGRGIGPRVRHQGVGVGRALVPVSATRMAEPTSALRTL